MAGRFRPRKFFPGFSLDYVGPNAREEWGGDFVLATVLEATRRAIDELNEDMHDDARASHVWENRTGQTEEAVFWQRAIIEGPPLRVWGEWGVEDRPRIKHEVHEGKHYPIEYDDEEAEHEEVTTMDVAMFLEFGTVKMAPRPWLYPVWDRNKVRLPGLVAKHYAEISAGGAATGLRAPSGRFIAQDMLR